MKELLFLNPKRRGKRRSRRNRTRARRTRRSSISMNPKRRRRRGGRRRSGGGGGVRGLIGGIKSALSKDTLMLGAGVVGGQVLGNMIFGRLGPVKIGADGKGAIKGPGEFKLPGTVNADGTLNATVANLYIGLGAVVSGLLIKRFAPGFRAVGEGAMIGGISTVIAGFAKGTTDKWINQSLTQGTSAYLNYRRPVAQLNGMPGPVTHAAPYQTLGGLVRPSQQFRRQAHAR